MSHRNEMRCAQSWGDLPVCEMKKARERKRPRQKGRRRGGEEEAGEGETVRRRRAHLLENVDKKHRNTRGFKRRSVP